MKRYYICRRLGTGIPGANDPFRSELYFWLNANYPEQRHYSHGWWGHVWAWCIEAHDLTTQAHDAAVLAIPSLYFFPEVALDSTVASIDVTRRNALSAKLDSAGFDLLWVTGATTVREVLEYIIQSCQIAEWLDIQIGSKAFDIRNKTVGNVPSAKRAIITDKATQFGVSLTEVVLTTPVYQVVQRFQAVVLRNGLPPFYMDQ
jgi:hypothetical protein